MSLPEVFVIKIQTDSKGRTVLIYNEDRSFQLVRVQHKMPPPINGWPMLTKRYAEASIKNDKLEIGTIYPAEHTEDW